MAAGQTQTYERENVKINGSGWAEKMSETLVEHNGTFCKNNTVLGIV